MLGRSATAGVEAGPFWPRARWLQVRAACSSVTSATNSVVVPPPTLDNYLRLLERVEDFSVGTDQRNPFL